MEVVDVNMYLDTSKRGIEKSPKVVHKFSTNWVDLPPEIKLHCIGDMDFRTKTSLGSTSRTESALVATNLAKQRHHFPELWIGIDTKTDDYTVNTTIDGEKLSISTNGLSFLTRNNKTTAESVIAFIARVLKYGVIDRLILAHLGKKDTYLKALEVFEKCAPFKVSNITSNSDNEASMLFFLKNCEGHVNKIDLMGFEGFVANESAFEEYQAIPQFQNANHIKITSGRTSLRSWR
ncbi:unnamed protein product [Caenorhabditis sp. 36 PRJEB53466]|nr:unnamed protein product [Caenorhabditis sp. 36 PRJEB53466]